MTTVNAMTRFYVVVMNLSLARLLLHLAFSLLVDLPLDWQPLLHLLRERFDILYLIQLWRLILLLICYVC